MNGQRQQPTNGAEAGVPSTSNTWHQHIYRPPAGAEEGPGELEQDLRQESVAETLLAVAIGRHAPNTAAEAAAAAAAAESEGPFSSGEGDDEGSGVDAEAELGEGGSAGGETSGDDGSRGERRPARRKGLEARRKLQAIIADEAQAARVGERQLRAGGLGRGGSEDRGPEKKKVGRPITYKGDPNSPQLTEEERRRVKRRIANRESARRVRQKRQDLLEDLQVKIQELQDRNAQLLGHVREVETSRVVLAGQMAGLKDKWSAAASDNLRLQGELNALRQTMEVVARGHVGSGQAAAGHLAAGHLAAPPPLGHSTALAAPAAAAHSSLFGAQGGGVPGGIGSPLGIPQLNTGIPAVSSFQLLQGLAGGTPSPGPAPHFLGAIPSLSMAGVPQPAPPPAHAAGMPQLSSPSLPVTPGQRPQRGPGTRELGVAPGSLEAAASIPAFPSLSSLPSLGSQPSSGGIHSIGAPIKIVMSTGQQASAAPDTHGAAAASKAPAQPPFSLFVPRASPAAPLAATSAAHPPAQRAAEGVPTPRQATPVAGAAAQPGQPSPHGQAGAATSQQQQQQVPTGFYAWLGHQLQKTASRSLEPSPGSAFRPPAPSGRDRHEAGSMKSEQGGN